MNIFLVSYFYKPLNNVASQRWRGFISGLEAKGFKTKVLTGPWSSESTAAVQYIKPFFGKEAIQKTGIESARAPQSAGGFKAFLKKFLPLFLFIDGKFFWSLKVSLKLLQLNRTGENKTDLVIITGTPWSAVALCSAACRFRKIPYVLDFRDFWSQEPFLIQFNSGVARKYFEWLERISIQQARAVLTVNDMLGDFFRKLAKRDTPVSILPNGFKERLDSNLERFNSVDGKNGRIYYAGTIAHRHGVDEFFELAKDTKFFPSLKDKMAFIGTDYLGLLAKEGVQNIPDQSVDKLHEILRQGAVLLLTLDHRATNYTTGKLMTYIQCQRPILFVGPAVSPAAKLIQENDIGWIVDSFDTKGLERVLGEIWQHLETKTPFQFRPNLEVLGEYSLDRLTEKLVKTLLAGESRDHVVSN